jgi:ABC-2 type transport system ATP-binding protein
LDRLARVSPNGHHLTAERGATDPPAMTGGSRVTGTALEAFGVAKSYQRRRPPALAGVDLAVPSGTITALVGPNGAGKSTLMKAWVGFERPTRGRVEVAGIDPFRHRYGALAHLAYIPQSAALYRDLTITEHLDLAGSLRRGFDRPLAHRRLDDLSIPVEVRAGALSGGQQAQVALAIALATRAPILVLDEPLAGLDPLARREFLFLLTVHAREHGTTAVLSSHVVSDVQQAADRLVVLGMGAKLLDTGVAESLEHHRIAVGEVPPERGLRHVASFLGENGESVTLLATDGSSDDAADGGDAGGSLRRPTLEELMLGYLAAGRPNLLDRIRAGKAGR